MTTSPTTKPRHPLIRSAVTVAALLLGMFVIRGYLIAHSAPGSALTTSGGLDIAAMVAVVGVVAAGVLVGKLRRRK